MAYASAEQLLLHQASPSWADVLPLVNQQLFSGRQPASAVPIRRVCSLVGDDAARCQHSQTDCNGVFTQTLPVIVNLVASHGGD